MSSYHFLPKVLCLFSLATKTYREQLYILCTLEQFRNSVGYDEDRG